MEVTTAVATRELPLCRRQGTIKDARKIPMHAQLTAAKATFPSHPMRSECAPGG